MHINYLNALDNQISLTGGPLGYRRLFGGGTLHFGGSKLLGALEWQRYDGPWVNPDELHKLNAVLRYSAGDDTDGSTLTAMHYHGQWNSTTDQPERALKSELITRFGSLDASDGGEAQRSSLTFQSLKPVAEGTLRASAYLFANRLTLWNDFTHFLIDPRNGDQEAQHESRTALGGAVNYQRGAPLFGLDDELIVGLMTRNDFNEVSRYPTKNRLVIPLSRDSQNFNEADRVRLSSAAAFAQATTHWTTWLRSVLGLRYDAQNGSDAGTNQGSASGHLLQPKGSLIFSPVEATEFYVSAGRGFHSDDLRGVTAAQNSAVSAAPLIARQSGEELGVRQELTHSFTMTFALYTLSAESETTYDPDAGVDGAGPASRRRGFEVNLTYQALRWLELYASYSANHARFNSPFDDGTGHVGRFLPTAPSATGSFNLYVKNLKSCSGSLGYRYLSGYPLSADDEVRGHGYGEWSAAAYYDFGAGWSAGLGLFNLLNKKADAAQFWYTDRLNGEPMQGVADVHVHPLEGRSARLTWGKKF